MFVWNAMPSISEMMSAILPEFVLIALTVVTSCSTETEPFSTVDTALEPIMFACRAFSRFSFTVAVSSLMLAAVSCSDAACCSVRADRSLLPAMISWDAVAIVSVPERTSVTMRTSPSFIVCSARITREISSFACGSTRCASK